jgi:hypothetical protein
MEAAIIIWSKLLIPIVSYHAVRGGAYLGYFSRYSMSTPKSFKSLVTFIGKEQWSTAPQPDIFFSVFIDI